MVGINPGPVMLEERTSLSALHSAESLLSRIGNTPLIRIRALTKYAKGVEIYGKAEWFNPGGSVKDRPALNMILEGERSGALTRNRTIIDATSGNTGIAYAMIGAALGYNVQLVIPANANPERIGTIRAYGAEVVFTDPLQGTDGAQEKVKEIVEANPDRYFYPDQYNNPANWQSHYKTTAEEILSQSEGRVTHFVAGLGTTGTFVGIARRLKEFNPSVSTIAFQPDSPLHGLEGLKHLKTAAVPGIYAPELADEMFEVSTEEAYGMVKLLARTEGLLVGVSAGASVAVCIRLAERIREGVIVTVLADSGSRYVSDRFWEET